MSDEARRSGRFFWSVSLIVLITLGAWIAGRYGAHRLATRNMSPAEIAEMERFFNDPVAIPPDWQRGPPFPAEALQIRDRITSGWPDVKNLVGGGVTVPALASLGYEDVTTLTQLVERADPWLVKFEQLARIPGYDIALFDQHEFLPNSSSADFYMLQSAVKLLCLRSVLIARDGRTSEALAGAVNTLQLARRHRASTMISHLIGFAVVSLFSSCIADIGQTASDPLALKPALDELNRLDRTVNLGIGNHAMMAEIVGCLRGFVREGYPVDLTPVKPLGHFWHERLLATEAYPEWKIQRLHPEDPLRAKLEQYLNSGGGKTRSPQGSVHAIWGRFGLKMNQEILYAIGRPNFGQFIFREQAAKARMDLARLLMAARIHEAETGNLPASSADLVPAHIPVDPVDPFSGKPYPWSSERKAFYSVGPDRTGLTTGVRGLRRGQRSKKARPGTLSRPDFWQAEGQETPESRYLGNKTFQRRRASARFGLRKFTFAFPINAVPVENRR